MVKLLYGFIAVRNNNLNRKLLFINNLVMKRCNIFLIKSTILNPIQYIYSSLLAMFKTIAYRFDSTNKVFLKSLLT